MKALQRTLAILATVCLLAQTVRRIRGVHLLDESDFLRP